MPGHHGHGQALAAAPNKRPAILRLDPHRLPCLALSHQNRALVPSHKHGVMTSDPQQPEAATPSKGCKCLAHSVLTHLQVSWWPSLPWKPHVDILLCGALSEASLLLSEGCVPTRGLCGYSWAVAGFVAGLWLVQG